MLFGAVFLAENPKVQVRLLPQTMAYLQDLLDTSAYGTTISDVAKSLIEAGIRQALADKIIEVRRRTRT
jgi:hypothetical protein